MVQKIVGKVGNDQKDFYCDAGEIETHFITYGVTRNVSRTNKKLLKKKNKSIKNSVAGKEIFLQCSPTNEAQGCKKQGGDEICDPVKVFDANL